MPASAAVTALLLALPFVLINAVVSTRMDPIYGWLVGLEVNNIGGFGLGFFVVLGLLLLWPMGAFIAMRPLLTERHWHVVNLAIAAILLVGFAFVGFALGEEIFRCDILQVANCD